MSRQACHVVSVLAEACGDRMEPLAVQLLPVLLKAVAMGIQVGPALHIGARTGWGTGVQGSPTYHTGIAGKPTLVMCIAWGGNMNLA